MKDAEIVAVINDQDLSAQIPPSQWDKPATEIQKLVVGRHHLNVIGYARQGDIQVRIPQRRRREVVEGYDPATGDVRCKSAHAVQAKAPTHPHPDDFSQMTVSQARVELDPTFLAGPAPEAVRQAVHQHDPLTIPPHDQDFAAQQLVGGFFSSVLGELYKRQAVKNNIKEIKAQMRQAEDGILFAAPGDPHILINVSG